MCRRYGTITCPARVFERFPPNQKKALSPEYFCTSSCPNRSCATYYFPLCSLNYWLPSLQGKNAFRASLLGFVFKLANSFVYVSSLKFTDLPPNLADPHAWESCCHLKWLLSCRDNFALLYFTVIFVLGKPSFWADDLVPRIGQSQKKRSFFREPPWRGRLLLPERK